MSDHLLRIEFPRPYGDVRISYTEDRELVIEIPYLSEASATVARAEMDVSIRPVTRQIDGELVEDGDGG